MKTFRRALAYVLVVDARGFPGLGGDRYTRFADELSGSLVEAHHGTLVVGSLGVEIKHVLHPGDEFSVDLRDAPHLLLPRFQLFLRETATDRVGRKRAMLRQAHHLVGQQR
jgi:hypothetical protein